jgi:hypothetical protein
MLPALIGIKGGVLRAGGGAGHADAVLVNQFSAGLSLVKKRANRDTGSYQERNSPAGKPRRKLDQDAPRRENEKRVHQVLSQNRVR